MKVIGITGGVGAGKSAVLEIFEEKYNAYVIKADDVAHELMSPGHKVYEDIVELIGEDILKEDGYINREKLAKIIFSAKNKRLAINSIVHPAVKKWIMEKVAYLRIQGEYEYAIVEAALLLEDHYDMICDEIWYVYADENTRRKRLKETRGYTDEKIDSILNSQMSEEKFRQLCDCTVDNNGTLQETYEIIKGLLK